jgi:ParB-like chromosome segregation protein Spo0J
MEKAIVKIPISDVVLDESIYPRETIDHRRIAVFEENIRDGFNFDPIEVQVWPDPDNPAKVRYRILDGRHRWGAYKKTGATHIDVVIITLDQMEPILYAAQMAIGPKQLTEAETRNTARRAFQSNPRLTAAEIGRAIGRSRQAVDKYISDLRATAVFDLELKIFRLHQLGIPQDRIAGRVGLGQQRISRYLRLLPQIAKGVNTDLSKGFSVPQVAQKHGWPESLVWSQALVNAGDVDRFKALQWGIRTWDVWNFMECDPRFGDDWPGRIPAQLVAHILYFFSEPGDLVLDPMAGGGVCADTCLAMGRRCWSLTHLIQAPMSSERFTGGVGDGNPHFEPNAGSNPNS